ncbi:MAG: nicotinamide mononucleotide transporter [Verrucomicrobia bacterium]|nr:nicotinamide mononucleotide transporter [Verrucomicrobiota bacterium]
MSYIELVGTVLYLWSVWLIAQRRMLTWPVGIVSVLLYMALFYQIRLYADAVEQIYYLAVSVYGWWTWHRSPHATGSLVSVRFSQVKTMVVTIGITAILSLVVGVVLTRVHLMLPSIFPEPASFPYLDAITTIMSLTAMWLLARKRTENWIYWIVVDLIGIGLYYVKGVKFVSLLYVVLLVLATRGLVLWLKAARAQRLRATT